MSVRGARKAADVIGNFGGDGVVAKHHDLLADEQSFDTVAF